MKIATILGAALLTAFVLPGPALARDQLKETDVVTIDPGKSYIFYRSKRKLDLSFFREVDDAERAAYEAARRLAYDKARAKYEKKLEQWRKDDAAYRDTSNDLRFRMTVPTKPDPLTPETFPYPPIEADNFLTIFSGPQFTKGEGDYTYLMTVEPGTYALYGQIGVGQSGPVGTCLCMGSVKFEARAGRIVDIGEIRYPAAEAAKAGDADAAGAHRPATLELIPASASMPLPAKLAGLPVDPADLRAAGKMPNSFGILIDRLPAIPGVLAYQRDRVIDVKAGGGAEAPVAH